MQASVVRNEALRLLKIEHLAVTELIDILSEEEMTRGDTIRYGLYYDQQCSCKDLLAHLICYEELTLEAVADWKTDAKHWVIDTVKDAHSSRDIHYGCIADREHLSLHTQIAEYRQVSTRLEQALEEMSDAQWHEPAPFAYSGNSNLGGMIESIMVTPPRPMYRHLPVHVPNTAAYIHSIRQTTPDRNVK